MSEAKTPAQIAADAAEVARTTARAAADAALASTLDSIKSLKDFKVLSGDNSFDAAKLKSAYIARFGFDRFQTLCGRSK
jgi:hypothetical protein